MNKPTAFALALALAFGGALAACSVPPRGGPSRSMADGGEGDPEGRRRLADLAEVVAIGLVLDRRAEPTGVIYTVLVQDLVRARPAGPAGTPAVTKGAELRVSSFLFRAGRAGDDVGPLVAGEQYLFFLTPSHEPGEWLNVADAALLPLPEALEAAEALRETPASGTPAPVPGKAPAPTPAEPTAPLGDAPAQPPAEPGPPAPEGK